MEHEKHQDAPDPPRVRSRMERTEGREGPSLALTPKSPAPPMNIGDEAWFSSHRLRLMRLAHTMIEREHAEDVVHTAILKFLRQRDGDPQSLSVANARSRLTSMLRDAIEDHQRKTKRQSRLVQLITGSREAVKRWMATPRSATDFEIRQAIHDGLQRLYPSYRRAWVIVVEQGYTVKETAIALGKSESTIRDAVHRANVSLQKGLRLAGFTPEMLWGRDDA